MIFHNIQNLLSDAIQSLNLCRFLFANDALRALLNFKYLASSIDLVIISARTHLCCLTSSIVDASSRSSPVLLISLRKL